MASWQLQNPTSTMAPMYQQPIEPFHTADLPYYQLKLYCNLVLAMAANALGFILILKASPKHIRIYRWFLLDILLSAFLLDLYFMAILQPFALLPVAGYCTLGILQFTGTFIGGFFGIMGMFFMLGFCGASALSAAIYRLLSVYNLQHRVINPWGIASIVGLHLLISSPLQVMGAFVIAEIYNQETIRATVFERYPSVRELLNSSQVCVFSPMEDSLRMRMAVYIGIAILVVIGIVGMGIMFAGFYSLWRRRTRISERLYRMHWQLSLSLVCQLLVPGITLYIPFFIVAISLIYKLSMLQDLVQFYAFVFSMHSTLNAFAMIAFTRPYRQAVLQWLCNLPLLKWVLAKTKLGLKMQKTKTSMVMATELSQQQKLRQKSLVALNAVDAHTRMGNF